MRTYLLGSTPRIRQPPANPPSIGDLRSIGMLGLQVTCANLHCRRTADLTFDALGMPDTTLFPDIKWSRRFRCGKCGGRQVTVFPDWAPVRAVGDGRPIW